MPGLVASSRQGPLGGKSASPGIGRRFALGRSVFPCEGELGLLALGEGGGQRLLGGLRAVAVDQGEGAGVLCLGGARQAPDRRPGGVGGLLFGSGDRALGDQREALTGGAILALPASPGSPPGLAAVDSRLASSGSWRRRGCERQVSTAACSPSGALELRLGPGDPQQALALGGGGLQLLGRYRAQGQGADPGEAHAALIGERQGDPPLSLRRQPDPQGGGAGDRDRDPRPGEGQKRALLGACDAARGDRVQGGVEQGGVQRVAAGLGEAILG